MTDINDNDLVLICTERLKALELLEQNLPAMIEAAILEHKKNNLKKLHERDKIDPASVNLRVKRYVLKHKEEINARRREKRKLKKAEANCEPKSIVTISYPSENEKSTINKNVIESLLPEINVPTVRKETKQRPLTPSQIEEALTVRFDY